jgi:hypothetical protein
MGRNNAIKWYGRSISASGKYVEFVPIGEPIIAIHWIVYDDADKPPNLENVQYPLGAVYHNL